jgi:hypothetical protein
VHMYEYPDLHMLCHPGLQTCMYYHVSRQEVQME